MNVCIGLLNTIPCHVDNAQINCRVVTYFESKRVSPVDFTSRTMGALNKIAEEHWKRQMKQEEKEEQLVRPY